MLHNHFCRPNPTEKTNISVYDFCDYPCYNFEFGSFIIYFNSVYPDIKTLTYGLVLHSWPDGNVIFYTIYFSFNFISFIFCFLN